jgi:sugar phosphate permease
MRSLRIRQAITVLLLFGGYGACYFCRADLAVGTPLLLDDLAKHGVSHDRAIVQIGTMSSLGVLAYALGKPFLGGLGDFGGKRGGAVSSGIIDAVGYLGGALAGVSVARISVMMGWRGVFLILAAVGTLAAVCASYLYALNTTTPAREVSLQ